MAGLGNPGTKYNKTRHNIGFLFLDYLARQLRVELSASKWTADAAKTLIEGEQALLLKPQTFMNLSGKSVAAAALYYKIPPENIIVIHDDLDMPVGKLKIVINRGAGGHNGIRSIISLLGSKNFIRIKAGIGRPDDIIPVERYVLTKMSKSEEEVVETVMPQVYDAVGLIISKGIEHAMNKINVRKNVSIQRGL